MKNGNHVFLDIDKTITSKNYFDGIKIKNKEFFETLANDFVPDRMKKIVKSFHDAKFTITIFTGRDIDYKKCTEKFWKNNFPRIKCKICYCGNNSEKFDYDTYVFSKVERMIRFIVKKKCQRVIVIDDDKNIIDSMKKNVLFTDLTCFKIPDDIESCERLASR